MPTFLQYYLFHFFANGEKSTCDAAVQGLAVHLNHHAAEQTRIKPLFEYHLLSALLFQRFLQFAALRLFKRHRRAHQRLGNVMCGIVALFVGATHAGILKQQPSFGNEL